MLGSSFFAGKMKGSMLLLLNAKVIHQMLWIQAGVEVVLLAMPEEYPQLHQGVVCKSYVSQVLRVSTLVDCVLLSALHTISLKIHQKNQQCGIILFIFVLFLVPVVERTEVIIDKGLLCGEWNKNSLISPLKPQCVRVHLLYTFFFLFLNLWFFFKASSSLWWTQLWLIFLPKPTFQPITIRPMHKHRGMQPSLSLGFIPTVFLFLCVFCRCLTELKSGEFGNQDISFYVAEQFLP